MVAKKRSTLRNKAASRASAQVAPAQDGSAMDFGEDPKAFLHQHRDSKRDKMLNKQIAFLSHIKEKAAGTFTGISKSSIRRRKRKLRDELKPKMNDLLVSLEHEVQSSVSASSQEKKNQHKTNRSNVTTTPGSVVIKQNEPSIRKQKGAKALSTKESKRFSQVLKNDKFQQNPFATLREVIKMQKL